MTVQNFISRLNWRQILIHFIACWFFILAFQTLTYLYDTKLIDVLRHSNQKESMQYLIDHGILDYSQSYFLIFTGMAGLIGLLVAFIVSWTISLKRGWYWVNAVITFTITFVLYRFNLLGLTSLRFVVWFPGQIFQNTTAEFISNGLILLASGLLIFFAKRPNQFIDKTRMTLALTTTANGIAIHPQSHK